MISTRPDRKLFLAIFPALLAGVTFELFLGHRHDYAGHFLAGYGGTLGLILMVVRVVSASRFGGRSTWSLVPLCLVCIGLGAIAEATVFRLAKFDEVDFCNQSLGAVLAAAAALAYTGPKKPPNNHFDLGLIAAVAFLSAGGCLAFV